MSALAPAEQAGRSRVSVPGVTFPRVVLSEWTKLWSLRSTRWVLLVSFIAMAAPGPIIAAVQMARWAHLTVHDRATFDSIDAGVGGWHLAQLGIGVLGVLVISGEYSTGMIRSSLMAVPRRLPVLAAKILVYAGVVFVLMLVATCISYFVTQAIVTEHHIQHGISAPGALRVVIGNVLFLTGAQQRRRHRGVRRADLRPLRHRRHPAHQPWQRGDALFAAQRGQRGGDLPF
jgi:ABC-2 type transport system permease protein